MLIYPLKDLAFVSMIVFCKYSVFKMITSQSSNCLTSHSKTSHLSPSTLSIPIRARAHFGSLRASKTNAAAHRKVMQPCIENYCTSASNRKCMQIECMQIE